MERILILLCALSAFPISTSKASPILTIFAQARHTMAISSSTEGSKTNSNILHYQNPVFAEVTNDEQQILGATSTMNPASTTLPPQQQQILKDSTMTTHQMQQNYSSSLNFTCSNPSQTEYKGKCLQVLQRLPCPPGEWLVEDAASGKGTCVENKCPNNANTGFYKGRCVKLSSENCPRGMRTYIYKYVGINFQSDQLMNNTHAILPFRRTGVVDCDCKDGHIYNSQDGFCYEAYRQGPCKSGMVFISTTDHVGRTTTMCKRNPCKTDGYYCSGGDFKCEQRKVINFCKYVV